MIVEAILVGSSLYEIRVNLICRIENIADVSLITLGGYLNDRDEAYLSGYGRKMISKNVGEIRAKNQKKNLSMKNNGETQRNARFRKLLTIHCATITVP